MKHTLRTAFAALLALFFANLAYADNALQGDGQQILNQIDDLITAFENGYSTPMRIVGSQSNTSVDIGIDTIRYVRKISDTDSEVSFDAHAKLQIPFAIEEGNTSTKIEFEGENLILAGTGTSVMRLKIGLPLIPIQKDKIWLRLGGNTYVKFNCAGVEAIGLEGEFLFSKSFIEAASNPNDTVRAVFNIEVADWDDLMFTVNFKDSFKIKGCGDFVFTIKDAIVDFSTVSNAPNFTFPAGYDTGFLQGDENLWTGFALKELSITPPNEMKELGLENSNESTNVESGKRRFGFKISNMLIDEWGLTGSFMASRAPLTQSGDDQNSGLNLSIDTIGVSFVQSYLMGGIISGSASVPLLKKDQEKDESLYLSLTGNLQCDRVTNKIMYRISVASLDDMTFGVPFTDKASITLSRGCSFTMGNESGKFGATLLLNGSLNISSGSKNLTIEGIRFEGLSLSTLKPHFDWRYFGLVGSVGMNFSGFSISLTELSLRKSGDDNAALRIAARLALMDTKSASEDTKSTSEDNDKGWSIAAAAGFNINAAYENKKWKYKSFKIDSISLNMDFSAFKFRGIIHWFDNHSTYGDGFEGEIKLSIKPVDLSLEADILFGKKYRSSLPDDYYKYWFAKIKASIPPGTYLFPPYVGLQSVTGGAYQRVKNTTYDYKFEPQNPQSLDISKEPNYVPDEKIAFGFIAGIGVYFANDNLVTAEALFEMAFNSNWGLNYIALNGIAAFMSKNVKGDNLINGRLLAYYNVENKTFLTRIQVTANIAKIIEGKASAEVYVAPDTWHFYLGSIYEKAYLSFAGLLKAEAYFMVGAIPNQLPPLSPRVQALFGTTANSTASGQGSNALLGKGFAFGIALRADCGFGRNKGFVFAYIDVEGGTDALVDFVNRICDGKEVKWRGKGQAYVYLDAAAGVRIAKKKYTILGLTAAAALGAEFPKPYYLEGKIAFKYKILFIKGSIKAKYSAGKQC